MKRSAFILSLASLLFTGCSKETAAPAGGQPGGSKGVIGLSVLTLTNPFFKEISDNLKSEAAKSGYEVVTVSGEFKPEIQRDQVKDFIVKKCAAIVLCPCDSKAIGISVKEANDAGIPVFTADIACLAEGVKIVSHIASNNLTGGQEAGKGMIEALGAAGGKVVVIHHNAVESCILRVKGFREVIDAHNAAHPAAPITIVGELPGGGGREGAFKCAEDALQANPDLAGIFAINDHSALGALAALEKAGRNNVKIIGFDGQPEGREAIKAGKIYGDPVQFPDQIGKQTAQAIVKHFKGEAVPKEILIPTKLLRKQDL